MKICLASIDRAIRLAIRCAILSTFNKLGERIARAIWEPHFRFHALVYETVREGFVAWEEAVRREIDELVAGKMGEIWEPER